MVKKEELQKGSKIKLQEFTKSDYEYLCNECMFTELQEQILKDRIKGKSIIQISIEQNVSERTVSKEIHLIKKKIDKII